MRLGLPNVKERQQANLPEMTELTVDTPIPA
jgi:hypothetical protein